MESLRHRNRRNTAWSRGVTLIEMIGVLSLIAIIAAAAVPNITQTMDQAAKDAEKTSLKTLSEGLIQASLKNRQFPTAAAMPQVIAAYLDQQTNAVRINRRRLARVFLTDPNMNLNGRNLLTSNYVQSATGSTNLPTNARVMILSTISRALPTIAPANFDNIWTTADDAVPSTLSTWGGRGEDLLIERIDLTRLFHKIVLMNVDPPPFAGLYSIDTAATASVASMQRISAYYMYGTVLNLHRSNGALGSAETIQADVSFVYQNNRWGRGLGADEDELGDFGQLVDQFLRQPSPCDPDFGATQRAVVNAFYDYLWSYSDWAFGNPNAVPPVPSFAGANTSSSPQYPSYSVVSKAQSHLSGSQSFTKNLIK